MKTRTRLIIYGALCVLTLSSAACGTAPSAVPNERRLSERAVEVGRARLTEVKKIESPLETKRGAEEYASALYRAADTESKELSSIGLSDRKEELDTEVIDTLIHLSGAASRLAVSVRAFDEAKSDAIAVESDLGKRITNGGGPPLRVTISTADGEVLSSAVTQVPAVTAEADAKGAKLYRRSTVLREQWDAFQQSVKQLEDLLGQAG